MPEKLRRISAKTVGTEADIDSRQSYTVGGISANTTHYASGMHTTTKNKPSNY